MLMFRKVFILFFLLLASLISVSERSGHNEDPFTFFLEFGGDGPNVSEPGRLFRKTLPKDPLALTGLETAKKAAGHYLKGDPEAALLLFNQSTDHFQRSGKKQLQGISHYATSLLLQKLGKTQEALQELQQAIPLLEDGHTRQFLSAALLEQARLQEIAGMREAAIQSYHSAAGVATTNRKKPTAAYAENKAGELLLQAGKDAEARLRFKKALRESDKASDPALHAVVLRNLGIVEFRASRFTDALNYFRSSLELQRKLPAMRMMRDTYLRLFAEKSIGKDSIQAQQYNRQYKLYRDSVEWMINSRALSPDSLAAESQEKTFINSLLSRDRKDYMNLESVRSLEYSQKLTEAELERLKAEEAMTRISQERQDDEVSDQERKERIEQLEREKALQELALSGKELKAARQQQVIHLLLAGVVLVVGGFGFTWNRYRIKKKSHQQLNKAYTELTETHRKLKSTQEQLIHAEKMASLGQMTAGIAHEIQNPLNFVNNFSEVSCELIEEMQQSQNEEERKELEQELLQNLQKIQHHGKRAESIVKSMLLHSRNGKSEKSLTAPGPLLKEYHQLAYHGFRSKHPDFQCSTEWSLDESLPEIPLVKQDMGRVLLNLFNNAFYALHQRKLIAHETGEIYEPVIQITALKLSRFATITIRDNGNGMPEHIKEKIFQPFYTTKPTGEGTGLGLSLCYDLIKAHSGEIKVESENNRGSAFTIVLPLSA